MMVAGGVAREEDDGFAKLCPPSCGTYLPSPAVARPRVSTFLTQPSCAPSIKKSQEQAHTHATHRAVRKRCQAHGGRSVQRPGEREREACLLRLLHLLQDFLPTRHRAWLPVA